MVIDVVLVCCFDDGDWIFVKGYFVDGDLEGFYVYNIVFYNLLVGVCGNFVIGVVLVCNNYLLFVFVVVLVFDWDDCLGEYCYFFVVYC